MWGIGAGAGVGGVATPPPRFDMSELHDELEVEDELSSLSGRSGGWLRYLAVARVDNVS